MSDRSDDHCYGNEAARLIINDSLSLGPHGVRTLLDDKFRDASDATLQEAGAGIFETIAADRITRLSSKHQGMATRALDTLTEVQRITSRLLVDLEALERGYYLGQVPIPGESFWVSAHQHTEAPSVPCSECIDTAKACVDRNQNIIYRLTKAGLKMSPERHARNAFLRRLSFGNLVGGTDAQVKFGAGGMLRMPRLSADGAVDELSDWGDPATPGRIAQGMFEGDWPEFASRLTLQDFEEAASLLAQADNKQKWRKLAAYVAKGGMGTVSPGALAADHRKLRAREDAFENDDDPENEDLGDDGPEK